MSAARKIILISSSDKVLSILNSPPSIFDGAGGSSAIFLIL